MDSNQDPYALVHLFPAGVIFITLSLFDEERARHTVSANDGWDAFDASVLLLSVTSQEDDTFLRHLEFLVKNNFVQATCRLVVGDSALLYIRIYVIPFDLANVQGRLRIRDENIMSPAREYLKHLLPRIRQGACWNGDFSSPTSSRYLIPDDIDNRTMAEIYSDLPSPVVNPSLAGPLTAKLLSGSPIEGLESVLHSYQRRSVAAMVQKELYIREVPDPLYVPITGIGGKIFYLQPTTMEVLRECPLVAQNRGGVLCEELGTGKTVMILALVLATLDQIPLPEESILDTRPALTPLALKYFPSDNYCGARKRASQRKTKAAAHPGPGGFPSLLETMVHYVRVTDGLDIQAHEEELRNHQLWEPIALNTPFYHHYDIESLSTNFRGRRKNHHATPPRVIYLTKGTLIIVPMNLLGQWESEINKHCYSNHFLRVLVVQRPNTLPCAKKLASDYDIILMTHNVFSAEAKASDVQKLHTWNTCTCPNYPDPRVRVPDCQCTVFPGVSSLLQIRWKRLVIDEGHVSASITTNMTPFAKLLSVERRWIVSGTPTTNLLGLGFGGNEELAGETPDSASEQGGDESKARIWTKHDREDLRKLATMIIHFLCVPQFAAQPKLFDSHLISPLFPREKVSQEASVPEARPPYPAAIQILQQMMGMVMIRHRIEDVEADITLPPVTHEHILLDLDGTSLKSYNAMQAIFAVNAVDSQRKDQDYFFHKRNVGPLNNALQNMSQIMFWHTDSNFYSIATHVNKGEPTTLADPKHSNISLEDRDLLHQAFVHMSAAYEDTTWKSIQAHLDVFYTVENMPRDVYQAWSPLSVTMPADAAGPELIHAERLLKLRELVNGHPLASEEQIKAWGKSFLEDERIRHRFYLESLLKRKRKKGKDDGDTLSEAEKPTIKRVEDARDTERTTALLHRVNAGGLDVFAEGPKLDNPPSGSTLLASSPVAQVRLGTSTSPKLNYILTEIQKHASDEKFLIFSNSPLTLAHIAEGLSLIRIKHLAYTSQVKVKEREQQVLTFETSDIYRVFLMELKHGARGLNLVTASRVIFCEPVWRADVESQAIKRAHRIGQTRPITVKTLAIKSTMEEMMISRRSVVQHSAAKASNNWAEESGMRDYIANPKFLSPGNAGDGVRLDISLIDVPLEYEPPSLAHPSVPLKAGLITAIIPEESEALPSSVGQPALEGGGVMALDDLLDDDQRSPKKRRVVKFADE